MPATAYVVSDLVTLNRPQDGKVEELCVIHHVHFLRYVPILGSPSFPVKRSVASGLLSLDAEVQDSPEENAEPSFQVLERNPLVDIALELEKIALEDDFFVSRNLYPNVDFYSGLIYKALGFPSTMFTVLFAMGRLPGWIANWTELHSDPNFKIARPRQIYTGLTQRPFAEIDQRS